LHLELFKANLCGAKVIYSRIVEANKMKIHAWFGAVDLDRQAMLTGGDGEDNGERFEACPAGIDAAFPLPQPDLRALAMKNGLFCSDAEYNARLRDAALAQVLSRLSDWATAEQDLLVAVQALDDMAQALNLLEERLYEWSRLHRQEIVHGRDLAEGLGEDKNMGTLARAALSLRSSRKSLEEEVAVAVQALAPNLSALAGPVLAARIISRAGGLSNLARMPSSRIQVMGAEKSLFKHLSGHAPSPKHGIIYRHPAVSGSARRLRGKTARTLAAKLAIAARLDAGSAGLSSDLAASLEARLKSIKQGAKKEKDQIYIQSRKRGR